MPSINSQIPELTSLNDLSENWKIAARSEPGVGWSYCGDLANVGEYHTFHRLAFPARDETPHISLVTGRDSDGALILYARIFPVALRGKRPEPQTIQHVAGGRGLNSQ